MRKRILLAFLSIIIIIGSLSFSETNVSSYNNLYYQKINAFRASQQELLAYIDTVGPVTDDRVVAKINARIQQVRYELKSIDIWLRYLNPVEYRKLNAALPIEWETEVFEKFEKPYKREGAGLTLAALYLEEDGRTKDSLKSLIQLSIDGSAAYLHDSVTRNLKDHSHFYLCNRMFLLNLASIYTTGFDCPDTGAIIPELRWMLENTLTIYKAFNESYSSVALSQQYMDLYQKAIVFAKKQPANYTQFDHYSFLKDYVNPLFVINQKLIRQHRVVSRSLTDYALNKDEVSIFDKHLYNGQNTRGIFMRVTDTATLAEIDRIGKLLFYDPILSGNGERACASCHKPTEYFTDTVLKTSPTFNHQSFLPRNTVSLIGTQFNQLVMMDGRHISLVNQARDVMTNSDEMCSKEEDITKRVLSCKEYKDVFTRLLKLTPQEKKITFEHISSAITTYYSKFSNYYAPFDDAMNGVAAAPANVQTGFNLFMGKAQCGTCHFTPQFNGVKPPFIESEFEVLGVPGNIKYQMADSDIGRYVVNPNTEMKHAFRTSTIRNTAYTKPYMHNGVFNNLDEVIEFYDNGGGAGRGLDVSNQTLSSDSLKLTNAEKTYLKDFIFALNERIIFEQPPVKLPKSNIKALNSRKVGGIY
ncbi:MAG: cytochrome C peroxidase [Sphingobacteriales bacterium]|nr:MAG: cytochrome C peroxidase [Sphingobacteriales bacterium]